LKRKRKEKRASRLEASNAYMEKEEPMSAISHASMMSINQYAGMIAEKQAWYYLESKGFEVRQFGFAVHAYMHGARMRLGRHSKSGTVAGIPLLVDCPETPDDYLKPKYAKKLREMFSEGYLKFFHHLSSPKGSEVSATFL
jgi:hypothetical protein